MKKLLALLLAFALFAGCAAQGGGDVSGVRMTEVDGRTYYVAETPYSGAYNVSYASLGSDMEGVESFPGREIMALEEHSDFCSLWGIPQAYNEPGNYAVFTDIAEDMSSSVELYGVDICHETATLYVTQASYGLPGDNAFLLAVPIPEKVTQLIVVQCIPGDRDIMDYINAPIAEPEKPILYLYPTEDTALTVTLGHPENVTCVYPAYEGGWDVLAHPDGTMEDLKTGRSLYALYWEGKNYPCCGETDGFVVRGEDSAAFLEEKLAVLGLTEREAEEFIIYWLPRLEASPYNFIRFAPQAELEEYMPLGFTVHPDTVIRVLMEYAPLDVPISVEPQDLTTPTRTGFAAVEWGGMEIALP